MKKHCLHCGSEFNSQHANHVCCSIKCKSDKMISSSRERFFSKVDKSGDCWIWIGPVSVGCGYGNFSVGKKQYSAHRYSWFVEHGVHPSMIICHKCDNKLCVNPDHLFEGTQRDNILDAKSKGRLAVGDRSGARLHPEKYRGDNSHNAKLREHQVIEIKTHISNGTFTGKELARMYGVRCETISSIKTGRNWRHVK